MHYVHTYIIIAVCTSKVNYSLGKLASSRTVLHSSRTANVVELCFAYVNIYSDNLLDSLSSLIMLSYLKIEMVYQCQ